jgi:cell division protein ZipA
LDGLRLALLILGIVVVAVVYFWTSRRRRLEREAGEFDRFDAWTNEELDPLAPPGTDPKVGLADYDDVAVDTDELTQPNLRLSAIRRALGRSNDEESRIDDVEVEESVGPADAKSTLAESAFIDAVDGAGDDLRADELQDRFPAPGFEPTAGAKVMNDLEAVANVAQARVAPQFGSLDEIKLDSQPSGPVIRSSTESSADSTSLPADGDEGRRPTANTIPTQSSLPGRGPKQQQEQLQERDSERGFRPPRERAKADGGADGVQDTAEMVVVLNVMATADQSFDGPALRAALESAGLKAGDMQLYHYRTDAQSAESTPIFSALNAVKPGTLDVSEFDGMRTPGIAMVLRMHGIERPSEAFELMLGAARSIADELDGQVCDETRSTLTGQALNHLRERITAAAFRTRSGA